MSVIKSLVIAFSMYSKIPMPHLELEEKDMRYVMGFFPLVGAVTGLIMYGLYKISGYLYVPYISVSLILMILPVVITGGIHLDGYMDTCDARNSYGDVEKKLGILKDSHIGAFAVIRLLVYYVVFFAFIYCIVSKECDGLAIAWAFTFFLSRIISGLAAVNLKGAVSKGMLYSFTSKADRKRVNIMLFCQLVLCFAGICFINIILAFIIYAVCVAVFLYYRHMAYKEFGGVTGDLAGYLLCVCELCITAAIGIISLLV